MPELDTTTTVDHTAEPQADLWTSDSERGETASDPLPSGATDPEPVAAAETPDETTAPGADTTTRDEKGQFRAKGSGKPRSDPAARVAVATAKEAAAKEDARVAREEAARYRAELETLRRPAATPLPVKPTPPPATTSDFPEYDAWQVDHPEQDWHAYMRAAARYESEQTLAAYKAEQQTQQILSAHRARITEAEQRIPDYKQVIETQGPLVDAALARRGVNFPPVLHQAVANSLKSPDILRDLALHPEDAAQLAVDLQTVPVSAAHVVQQLLEQRLTTSAAVLPDSASVVRPSAAKAPINRVGGTASATPASPDDLEFGPEYIRAENAREKKQREASRW